MTITIIIISITLIISIIAMPVTILIVILPQEPLAITVIAVSQVPQRLF